MNNALEEYIIAYIDLLGVKEKIKNGNLEREHPKVCVNLQTDVR